MRGARLDAIERVYRERLAEHVRVATAIVGDRDAARRRALPGGELGGRVKVSR